MRPGPAGSGAAGGYHARFTGRGADALERPGQEPAQRRALLGVERGEHLVLDALESPLGALERLPAGRSDLDDVPPAVARIATTLDEALVLQVVEQKDEVVGVEVQRLA